MKKKKYTPEAGEETLALLIREAGTEARARKKKAMKVHTSKLRDAIHNKLSTPLATKTT